MSALDMVRSTSCVLSIIGASVVMLVCRYPETNRKRSATQLIFWLSFADFCTAIVYLLASFESQKDENTTWCQTTALLGIFFPVASFCWTDVIAYYLYSLVMWNRFRSSDEWGRTMMKFHFYCWGIALVCIIFVASFDHAGKDTDSNSNTGGWCWVRAHDKTQLFLWELIGGKFVEWLSAFVILPYLYAASAYRLISLEKMSKVGDNYVERSSLTSLSLIDTDPGKVESGNAEHTTSDSRPSAVSVGANNFSSKSGLQFKQFYVKMAMVPLLFFFIRCWGSIRAVFYYAEDNHDNNYDGADGWLKYMQAFFDPSQGFFNALLFVVTSTEGRRDIVLAAAHINKFSRLFLIEHFPFLMVSKNSTSSNIDNSNLIDSDFMSSDRKYAGGATDTMPTNNKSTGVESSSYLTEESQAHNMASEARFHSEFSAMSEGGHRMSSTDQPSPNDLDFLTVPENVTVHTLVHDSLAENNNA
jgi:hypothetical protein